MSLENFEHPDSLECPCNPHLYKLCPFCLGDGCGSCSRGLVEATKEECESGVLHMVVHRTGEVFDEVDPYREDCILDALKAMRNLGDLGLDGEA